MHLRITATITGFFLAILLSAVLAILSPLSVAAFSTTWTNSPNNCVPAGPLDMWEGQNCYDDANCGTVLVEGQEVLQCVDPGTLAAPGSNSTTSTVKSGSYTGGYLLNCLYTNGTCSAASPTYCNASGTCVGYHRDTRCNSNTWAGDVGAFSCSATCQSTYNDCNLDGLNCEIHNGDSCGSYPINAIYNGCSGSVGRCVCPANSYDCTPAVPFDNICESVDGGDCTDPGTGLDGILSCTPGGTCEDGYGATYTCTCNITPQHFITAIDARYSSTDPLLWGTQLGAGDLARIGNGTTANAFTVANNGLIQTTTSNSDSLKMRFFDGTDNVGFYSYSGDPDGLLVGTRGSLALDYANGRLFINTDDSTGWNQIYDSGSSPSYTFSTGLTNASGTITANISTGMAGGQTIYGGTGSGDDLTIESTTNGTKGDILLNPSGGNVGIGTSTPDARLEIYIGSATNQLYLTDGHGPWGASGATFNTLNGDLTVSAVDCRMGPCNTKDIDLIAEQVHINGNTGDFVLAVNGSIGPDAAPTATSISRTMTAVDSSGWVGGGSSIEIGADGYPVISYTDTTNGNIKAAKCTNTSCTAATITVVDPSGNVGGTSLAIGIDGYPVISYYSAGLGGGLKVAKCTNSSCTATIITTMDIGSGSGTYSAIAIGIDGYPVISYFESLNGYLKAAKCTNINCTAATITTLDTAANVGRFTSIAIGTDGNPVISYFDVTNIDLKVAKCTDTSCTAATVTSLDTANTVGQYTSIAIGTDANPVISYYNSTSLDLKVAKCTNSSCTAAIYTTVDVGAGRDIGQFSSIAIGRDGNPVISYADMWSMDLKVAKCMNSSCTAATITAVDTAGNVGLCTSLAISTDGYPVISHASSGVGLRVVKCVDQSCAATTGTYYAGGSDLGSSGEFFNKVYAVNYFAKEGMQISNFDLAEDYEVQDSSIVAGDIVAISGMSTTAIAKSGTKYQTDVIGVISTKPGLKLTDWELSETEKEKMRPVALAGRAPVKVTTENGPIVKGDRLVSSSRAGYAMKACGTKYCEAGISVGFALESFNVTQEGDTAQAATELSTSKEETIAEIESAAPTDEAAIVVEERVEKIAAPLKSSETQTGEGRIVMFINLSWYDPGVNQTLTELSQTEKTNSQLLSNPGDLNAIALPLIDTALYQPQKEITSDRITVIDLNVTGLLSVETFRTKVIEAQTAQDLTVKLSDLNGATVFKITNSDGEPVFKVDSTGKLSFKTGTSTSSVGKSLIKAGDLEVDILTKAVTNVSNVYLTLTTDMTDAPVLQVAQKVDGSFKVKMPSVRSVDVSFDWWVIN